MEQKQTLSELEQALKELAAAGEDVVRLLRAFATEGHRSKENLFFFYGWLHGLFVTNMIEEWQKDAILKAMTYVYHMRTKELENIPHIGNC